VDPRCLRTHTHTLWGDPASTYVIILIILILARIHIWSSRWKSAPASPCGAATAGFWRFWPFWLSWGGDAGIYKYAYAYIVLLVGAVMVAVSRRCHSLCWGCLCPRGRMVGGELSGHVCTSACQAWMWFLWCCVCGGGCQVFCVFFVSWRMNNGYPL
jgi:hypothetical protein